MLDLVCVAFEESDAADQVLNELREKQREYLVNLDDACVAIRELDGTFRLKPADDCGAGEARSSLLAAELWKAFVGHLFQNLPVGMAISGTVRAPVDTLPEHGIPDDYIGRVAGMLVPGTSALFMLVGKLSADKNIPTIAKCRGTVLRIPVAGYIASSDQVARS